MIAPEPDRVMPVNVQPELVPRIISGRVRVLHVLDDRALRIGVGDALWVREGVTISAPRVAGDDLLVRYLGDPVPRPHPWPGSHARPEKGWLPAERMPLQLSRLTLLVLRVTRIRLQQIDESDILAAGVELAHGGFGNPLQLGASTSAYRTAHEAFGHFWDCLLGQGAIGRHAWTCNPEVTQIRFRALARNARRLVPGLGSGGVM